MRHRRLALATSICAVGIVAAVAAFTTDGGHSQARPVAVRQMPRSTGKPALPSSTPVVRPPHYRYTTVSFAGALDAQISGINNAGAYTGNIVEKSGSRAFVVPRPGARPIFFTLPYPADPETVQVAGIDTAGGIVGSYVDPTGVFQGFSRSANGTYTRLTISGAGRGRGEGTEIAGLSSGGVIVGSYITSAKVATGFIDRGGRITRYVEKSAGRLSGEGTAVEFYSSRRGYGGVFISPGRVVHGWYVRDGKLHVVDDPAAGKAWPRKGTQLVGVDSQGRLYGIESPPAAATGSVSVLGGAWSVIRDPLQMVRRGGQTLVLGVSAGGVVVGSYTYDALGRTRAFIARPVA